MTEQEKRAYSEYLKRRIRPVMEKLIKEEDTEKMEKIEEFGWYGRAELDTLSALQEAATKSKAWCG